MFNPSRRPTSQKARFPAPSGGWVQNVSMMNAPEDAAEVLDNIFPTAAGARLRGGKTLHATIAADVVQIMSYQGASGALFAADANNVYDITTPADPAVSPSADITSLTNGDWSYINFATSGGKYLWMVNGADSARHFDGTSWAAPTITAVTSSTLSQVWAFKSRIFCVKNSSLSAWYLPSDSIAGAAAEFPMASIFTKGGKLLFGTTWSLDSGTGLDDVCVFVTDQGEVAVYEGTDPSSASTFSLTGVYDIAVPLSKHAWFRAGGDVAIATEDGIVSLASAVQKDRIAISRDAITYPIEDAWREAVTLRSASHRFNCTMWPSKQMLMVSVPNDYAGISQAYVANARTGKWCRFTGWDVQCSGLLDDQLYFGSVGGQVYTAETGGEDEGAAYTGSWLPKFRQAETIVALNAARVAYRGNVDFDPELTGATDFDKTAPGDPASATDTSGSLWGTGVWGTMLWGGSTSQKANSEWQVVDGVGNGFSVWVKSTSGRETLPSIEILGMDVLFEKGRPL